MVLCTILFPKACLIGALPTQIIPPACLMGPGGYLRAIYLIYKLSSYPIPPSMYYVLFLACMMCRFVHVLCAHFSMSYVQILLRLMYRF